MLPVLDTQLLANPPHSGYGTSKVAGHLVWGICHPSTVAVGRAQVFKFLHTVMAFSSGVPLFWDIGGEQKKAMVLILCTFSISPFKAV